MLGDQGIMYYESFSGQNSEENSADLYSLNLIYNYSAKKGDCFQEPGTFIQNYGIPSRMMTATKKLFSNYCN